MVYMILLWISSKQLYRSFEILGCCCWMQVSAFSSKLGMVISNIIVFLWFFKRWTDDSFTTNFNFVKFFKLTDISSHGNRRALIRSQKKITINNLFQELFYHNSVHRAKSGLVGNVVCLNMIKHESVKKKLPSCYSWPFGNIMPSVMWHDDSTEEDGQYSTERKELT